MSVSLFDDRQDKYTRPAGMSRIDRDSPNASDFPGLNKAVLGRMIMA